MSTFEVLLENVISFCATIDEEISVITDEANEWASYSSEKIVVIPNDMDNMRPVLYAGAKYFLHHICTTHHLNAYEYGENFLSLLHEIGHIYTTRWEPCNALTERKKFERQEGQFAKIKTLAPLDYEYHRIYFDTIYEFNATAWAVRWVKEHPAEAKAWSELIG